MFSVHTLTVRSILIWTIKILLAGKQVQVIWRRLCF